MKKELLTIALAMTMGLSLSACKGASKTEDSVTADTSEKTVEKTTIKKDTSTTTKKNTDDEEDTDDKDNMEDESSTMKDEDTSSDSETSTGDEDAYKAILDAAGYSGKATKFANEKTLKNTSFAKYITGGIEIIEVGSNKDVVYEIIDTTVYPLTGYTEEQMEAVNTSYQTIPAQYSAYDWIEVTCTLEDGCEVVRFRYKNLDDETHAAALPLFGHSSYTDLSIVTTGYLYGGWTQK